jgi:putative ABC transport system permease protein
MNLPIFQVDPANPHRRRCFWQGIGFITLIAITLGLLEWQKQLALAAKTRLGGDIEIEAPLKPVNLRANAFLLFNGTRLSRLMEMQGAAGAGDEQRPVLLIGIDRNYPLYGELVLKDVQKKNIYARLPHQPVWGAAVEESLLKELALHPGDRMKVGKAEVLITASITHIPDTGENALPRVLVSKEAFGASGLMENNESLLFHYRLQTDAAAFRKQWTENFPRAPWRVRDWRDVATIYQWVTMLFWLAIAGCIVDAIALLLTGYRYYKTRI